MHHTWSIIIIHFTINSSSIFAQCLLLGLQQILNVLSGPKLCLTISSRYVMYSAFITAAAGRRLILKLHISTEGHKQLGCVFFSVQQQHHEIKVSSQMDVSCSKPCCTHVTSVFTYRTERVKSPGLLLLGLARKLPSTPRVSRRFSASTPVMFG